MIIVFKNVTDMGPFTYSALSSVSEDELEKSSENGRFDRKMPLAKECV